MQASRPSPRYAPMPAAVVAPPTRSRSTTPTRIPASAHSKASSAPATMPAPTIKTSKLAIRTEYPAEGIGVAEQKARLGRNASSSVDRRNHSISLRNHRAREHGPQDALLPPDLARPQLSICIKTGHLRTGARSAGERSKDAPGHKTKLRLEFPSSTGGPSSSIWSISTPSSPVTPLAQVPHEWRSSQRPVPTGSPHSTGSCDRPQEKEPSSHPRRYLR